MVRNCPRGDFKHRTPAKRRGFSFQNHTHRCYLGVSLFPMGNNSGESLALSNNYPERDHATHRLHCANAMHGLPDRITSGLYTTTPVWVG